MMNKPFPVIDPVATGANIVRLREDRGLSVRDLQTYFGFEEPRAIYKWQSGQSLPTVDNLYALGALLDVTVDDILVKTRPKLNILVNEPPAEAACCSPLYWGHITQLEDTAEVQDRLDHLLCGACVCVVFSWRSSSHTDVSHCYLPILAE